MALQYTVRPISDRTQFTNQTTWSKFLVRWSDVLDLLEREYKFLQGKQLVIEVDVPESAIRNDGTLRADAKAHSQAVRIAFESKHGPITMATDRFIRTPGTHYLGQYGAGREKREQMPSWQHNVYAIAKALEALRMVDRYGVSRSGEQYRGYKAIGGGDGVVATGMTTDTAMRILRDEAGLALDGPVDPIGLVKRARAAAHPDRHNGARSRYDAVDQAVQVLERAGRLS